VLEDSIKEVGEYQVEIELYSDITQKIKVTIEAQEES